MPKAETKGFFKASMTSRQLRRVEREELKKSITHNSVVKDGLEKQEAAIAKINQLLDEAGVQRVAAPELKFTNPEAHSHVEFRLRRLAYTPSGERQDPWLPWAGRVNSIENVKKLLKKLNCYKHALDMKTGTLDSITTPSTTGMLTEDGNPNKDLQQLLVRTKPVFQGNEHVIPYYHLAMERLVKMFLDSTGGEKVRFNVWAESKFRKVMSKALKESSPGYPMNGFNWHDDLGDRTCFEEVYRLGVERLTNSDNSPFLFTQGARYTGDGGDSDEGKQRLVMQAPANEKLLGHIIAEPLKAFAKLSPSSGQWGIQRVTEELKKLAQGKREPHLNPGKVVAFMSADISQWDTAQTDEFCEMGFWEFLNRICDLEDKTTAAILANYKEGYVNRILWTAMGFLRPNMLPSGSSITTVLAFVHHWLILLTVDEWVYAETGVRLFAEIGLQGDDQVAALLQWNDFTDNAMRTVYDCFNCRVKGDLRLRWCSDPDVSAVFLNECIHLMSDQPNFKFPRWNFFFAETHSDLYRGVNIDRMLLDEILNVCAHPSPRELLVASYLSKMDRFFGLPFYDKLLKWSVAQCTFPLRSWLGERVMPNSKTLEQLKLLEVAEGIERPSETQVANDRQVDVWYHGQELGQLAALFWLGAQEPVAKPVVRKLIKAARSYSRNWRRAGRVVGPVITNDDKRPVPIDEFSKVVQAAFEQGYADVCRAIKSEQEAGNINVPDHIMDEIDKVGNLAETVNTDGEPVYQRTLQRAILALNDSNPWELTKFAASMCAEILSSGQYDSWDEATRLHFDELYSSVFGSSPHQLGD